MLDTLELLRRRSPPRKMLFLICAIVFLDFLAAGILIPLIPFLIRQLSTQGFTVGLAFTAFAVGQFIFSPLLGVLSDRYGRRLVLLVSTFGGMLASSLLSIANAIPLFLTARFLDGMTGGNLLVAQAYIADITLPEHRAKNFGLLGVALGLAFILGPAIGGGLSQISLQLPAIVAALLYLLTASLVWIGLPESLSVSRRRKAPVRWVELNPLRQILRAFQRPSLRSLLGAEFLLNFAENGLRSNLQVLTAEKFGLGIQQNAILFSYLGILSVLTQGIALRFLIQRIPDRTLTLIGLGAMIGGYGGIAVSPSVAFLYGSLTFNAVGFGLASPTLLSLLSKGASEQEQGFLVGATQAIASLSLILSPALAGFKFDRLGTGAPYWTGAVLLSLAILVLLNRHRLVEPEQ